MAVTTVDFDQTMNVNVRGVMLCYKHAARQMIKQGRGGRIIGQALFISNQIQAQPLTGELTGASSIAGKSGDLLFMNQSNCVHLSRYMH